MRKVKFDVAVTKILKHDSRFKSDAYFFLREALELTVTKLRSDELVEHRHVSARELLNGFKDHALNQLGSMALPILESWGVASAKDVGHMVYNLIQVEAFGKSDDDDPRDFEGWMSFTEAFQKPFRPTRPVLIAPTKRVAPLESRCWSSKSATTSEI
jgi:uncharacterized repeat protein (TIGR04138 family)